MAEKKITKKENFTTIINVLKGVDIEESTKERLIKAMEHEIELINNKAKGTKKVNTQNEEIAKIVVEELGKLGTPVTVTDLLETSETLKNYVVSPATETEKEKRLTNQKLSAILTKLKENGVVTRTVEKKKSYFALVNVA